MRVQTAVPSTALACCCALPELYMAVLSTTAELWLIILVCLPAAIYSLLLTSLFGAANCAGATKHCAVTGGTLTNFIFDLQS